MTLSGRHRDDDDALLAARVHEPGAQASDQRRGHTAREMLLVDGDATRSPQRSDGVQRRREDADVDLPWLEPRGHGGLDDLPAPGDVTAEHPRPESLLPHRYPRMASAAAAATVGRCRRPHEIGRIDHPRAADLPGRQDPQPDATVDRHVVDPEKIGRLVQAEMAGSVRRDQPASVPANTCQARADFATRLSMK